LIRSLAAFAAAVSEIVGDILAAVNADIDAPGTDKSLRFAELDHPHTKSPATWRGFSMLHARVLIEITRSRE